MEEDSNIQDPAYREPTKGVYNFGDMSKWKNSEAYAEYRGFLMAVNEAVKGKAKSASYPESPSIQIYLNLLNELDEWVAVFPPVTQPQRFGNRAFKDYYEYLKKEAGNLLRKHLPEKYHKAIPEIQFYLIEGVGNSTRIDYGTGHEIAFLWHISCLFKIGFFSMEDQCAIALKIFDRYLELVRKLQTTYKMEPAGSRGVWSLDDFQFVPFIWGSSQLAGNSSVEPSKFYDPDVVNRHHSEYLFIGCVNYINKVKTGPFFEHSNQLYNLSGVDNWSKINQGLIKMYEAEILNAFPVVQHFLFGSLMPITASKQQPAGPPRGRPGKRLPPPVDPTKLPPPN